jgi:predicted amidophosphoribosyltransferase
MASYKQPCIHCNTFIDKDVRFCPTCGSQNPFGYLCPTCLRPIEKEQALCAGCGRPLYVNCPHCAAETFVQERCEKCGQSLMIRCENKRCQVFQFFENTKCTACGKKIKAKLEKK